MPPSPNLTRKHFVIEWTGVGFTFGVFICACLGLTPYTQVATVVVLLLMILGLSVAAWGLYLGNHCSAHGQKDAS